MFDFRRLQTVLLSVCLVFNIVLVTYVYSSQRQSNAVVFDIKNTVASFIKQSTQQVQNLTPQERKLTLAKMGSSFAKALKQSLNQYSTSKHVIVLPKKWVLATSDYDVTPEIQTLIASKMVTLKKPSIKRGRYET